ncbi:MAG: type II secretion system F family protein [Sporichthyaceae bacterium]|nr:type II secretion system F family protein [Sporichthyaceae bacterium]
MNWNLPLGVLAGLLAGGGLTMAVLGIRGTDRAPGQLKRSFPVSARRLLAGLGAGLAMLAVTRWVAPALALATMIIIWDRLFGGARTQQAAIARLEALAAWIESVRDTIATGTALPEALPASLHTAHPLIAPALRDLVARMQVREPVDTALLRFADDLDDVTADEAVAALVLNARTQGRQLKAVLSALSGAIRRNIQARRRIESDRRGSRRSVKVIVVVTALVAGALSTFNSGYVEPYRAVTGQLVLFVVVVLFAGGLWWIRAIADFDQPRRFLATPAVRAAIEAERTSGNTRGAIPRRWSL